MRGYLVRSRTRAADRGGQSPQVGVSREHVTRVRTPLNAMIGFSEVLLDPSLKVTEEERAQFLTDILGSGKHLLGLINEILDLAKIEAGKMELQIEPTLLSDILESVQNTMRSLQ